MYWGFRFPREVKRGGRQIDMENGTLPHRPALDPSRGVNEKGIIMPSS